MRCWSNRVRRVHLWCRAWLLVLPACSACSCAAFFQPFMAKDPHVRGTWTGQLRSVTVEDSRGERHQAAAIQIHSGPRTLRPSGMTGPSYTLRDEDMPYLTRIDVLIVDPAQLSIPLGSVVRVRGQIINHPARG